MRQTGGFFHQVAARTDVSCQVAVLFLVLIPGIFNPHESSSGVSPCGDSLNALFIALTLFSVASEQLQDR